MLDKNINENIKWSSNIPEGFNSLSPISNIQQEIINLLSEKLEDRKENKEFKKLSEEITSVFEEIDELIRLKDLILEKNPIILKNKYDLKEGEIYTYNKKLEEYYELEEKKIDKFYELIVLIGRFLYCCKDKINSDLESNIKDKVLEYYSSVEKNIEEDYGLFQKVFSKISKFILREKSLKKIIDGLENGVCETLTKNKGEFYSRYYETIVKKMSKELQDKFLKIVLEEFVEKVNKFDNEKRVNEKLGKSNKKEEFDLYLLLPVYVLDFIFIYIKNNGKIPLDFIDKLPDEEYKKVALENIIEYVNILIEEGYKVIDDFDKKFLEELNQRNNNKEFLLGSSQKNKTASKSNFNKDSNNENKKKFKYFLENYEKDDEKNLDYTYISNYKKFLDYAIKEDKEILYKYLIKYHKDNELFKYFFKNYKNYHEEFFNYAKKELLSYYTRLLYYLIKNKMLKITDKILEEFISLLDYFELDRFFIDKDYPDYIKIKEKRLQKIINKLEKEGKMWYQKQKNIEPKYYEEELIRLKNWKKMNKMI